MVHPSTEAQALVAAPQVVFVLGPPGAGKGTLFKRLAKERGYCHLSVGDYLRELASNEDMKVHGAYGGMPHAQLRADLQERKLVPAEILTEILAHKIDEERGLGHTKFVLDGFPRQPDSAQCFEERIAVPSAVFWACCDRETAKARFIARGRGDDDGKIFDKRYAEYCRLNEVIVKRYEAKIHKLNTDGEPEETYAKLLKLHQRAVGEGAPAHM